MRVTHAQAARLLRALSDAALLLAGATTRHRSIERLFPGLYPPFLHILRLDTAKLGASPQQPGQRCLRGRAHVGGAHTLGAAHTCTPCQ